MKLYQRDEIIRDLRDHVAEVTFKKLDGSQRKMQCTLLPSHLPRNYNADHLEEMHQKEPNLETVVCWDIQKQGWRSFHVDLVEYVQILDNF